VTAAPVTLADRDRAFIERFRRHPGGGLVVISCSGGKLDSPAPARDLYTGELFRRSVTWAESWDLPWCVCSALHGLVDPDATITPYDLRLADVINPDYDHLRFAIGAAITVRAPRLVITLAGATYADLLRRATVGRANHWAPLVELPQRGYGHYLRWLAETAAP
jgi:hypothetical protein